ncbi:c-type cytochrome [Gallaecimonas kandeliae]|uniref:c-type cytochrome n=1 Tax=Gallaecimonas kandeliae TaxID=3029055 RepID=UPI002648F2DA|nr:c-type cytochrome [Gallaecimonas kandeliae]WKE65450.1 c-type cytochrome [Gallaecimonas kandeliae]
MKKIALAVILLAGTSSQLLAQGDADAGKAKSAVCAACHGPDGNSPVGMYPRLAGQHASYIIKELHDLKKGMESGGKDGRYDPVMSSMAAPLSDQDMADLAAYFSSQTMAGGTTPKDVVKAGHRLFMGGDLERGIPACTACHGPRGDGHSLARFPDISGQHPEYIKTQLERFRAGQRANDPNGMMRQVAAKLTDQDIDILSKYLAGLH